MPMKSDAARMPTAELNSASVAEQVRQTRQRLLDVVTRRPQLRSTGEAEAVEAEHAASALGPAVAAVVNRLPKTGAVPMKWKGAPSLFQLAQPSSERLRELQEELRKANVLFAFGSHVVSFARDAG